MGKGRGRRKKQAPAPWAHSADEAQGMCMASPMMSQARGNGAAKEALAKKKGPPQGQKRNEPLAKALGGLGMAKDGMEAGGAALASKYGAEITEGQAGLLGKLGTGVGAGLGFLGHFFGDEQVADSTAGHAVNSAAKTAGDVGVAGWMSHLAKSSGVAGTAKHLASNPIAGLVAAGDGLVDVDNPMKMATATASEIVPGSQAGKAIAGGVDAATAGLNYLSGDHAAAYRGAEQTQENAVNGNYGAVTSSLTYGTAALMGDHETLNKATDMKAKTGERGIWTAWGNAAADMWSGDDETKGWTVTSWEEEKEYMDNLRWYNPFSW